MKKTLTGLALAFLAVAAFASTFVVGGALTRGCGVSPLAIVVIRFFFASLVLMTIELRTPERRRRLFHVPAPRDWLWLFVHGIIGTSFMAWLIFAACGHVSSANAAMSDAMSPLFIFLYAALRERSVTPLQCVGAAFGFTGVLLVIGIICADGISLSAYGIGDLFVLGSAVTWAIYTLAGRSLVPRVGSAAFTVWTMFFGAVGAALVLPFVTTSWPATPRAWGYIAYICFVPTLVAFWSWNASLKYLATSTAAMTAYFTPVIAAAIAWLFFGETLTGMQVAGTLFVCVSAVVELRGKGTKTKERRT